MLTVLPRPIPPTPLVVSNTKTNKSTFKGGGREPHMAEIHEIRKTKQKLPVRESPGFLW
jgi:hypothetical protein